MFCAANCVELSWVVVRKKRKVRETYGTSDVYYDALACGDGRTVGRCGDSDGLSCNGSNEGSESEDGLGHHHIGGVRVGPSRYLRQEMKHEGRELKTK